MPRPPLPAVEALDGLVAKLAGGEERPGQRDMCGLVEEALASKRHLLAEAGTGVGKSLAYLVPAVLSGQRVVIATATKALQDQLVGKDLPFLHEHLDFPFEVAVLKGRSNYLCMARLAEAAEAGSRDHQLKLVAGTTLGTAIPELVRWAPTAETGERDDLPLDVPGTLWDALTISPRECPGAAKCPQGETCFAEHARERALSADLVIVNTHLYCLDLGLDGALLGEHDAVIIDEAHTLEEIAASVFGISLGPGRFTWLAAQLRGVLVREAKEVEALERLAAAVGRVLEPAAGTRVDPGAGPLADALVAATQVTGQVLATLRSLKVPPASEARRLRVLQAADGLARELGAAAALTDHEVAWVDESEGLNLRVAPVDVGPPLMERLFCHRPAILTSATLSVGRSLTPTAWNLGLRDASDYDAHRLASPFDYRTLGLLYCARHLPDPRDEAFTGEAIEELARLIEAAGGRTLALFTSYKAMEAAADAVEGRWEWPVLVQDGGSRAQLLAEFVADEHACLFATMSFWQGVDVPGDAVRLVVVDKLPFGRPDEPLTQARREAAEALGRRGFEAVDLPRAARLLAQGAGRLIRSTTDRGVVAVLDRRLATAGYRAAILDSLPPFKRTVDHDEVTEFLRSLDGETVGV